MFVSPKNRQVEGAGYASRLQEVYWEWKLLPRSAIRCQLSWRSVRVLGTMLGNGSRGRYSR